MAGLSPDRPDLTKGCLSSRLSLAAEESLPELGAVIDQAPCAMVLLEAGGEIAFASRRIQDLFGLAPSEAIGRRLHVLMRDGDRLRPVINRFTDSRASRFRSGEEARLTLTGRRRDGTEFPIDMHLSSVRRGARCWALVVLQDVTERCRMLSELQDAKQQAEMMARVKGEFLSYAAHDLTQPVQALELAIDSIQQKIPALSEITELTEATGSVARMRELLKMLLEISKIESGTLRVEEEPVAVAEMFACLERQFAAAARGKGLEFICGPSVGVIETDPVLLRSLLGNLLGNAIRYTPAGEVRLCARSRPDGGLSLEVSDTGIGIPSAELMRIFEDFHRLEEARSVTREGFGLGLGIVRRLSRLLGFALSVQSTIGRGSTFSIGIPSPHHLRASQGASSSDIPGAA